MAGTHFFEELIRLVRTGDQAAAQELVSRYEGSIRRAARVQLGSARLCRLLDSTDICQSVLASFFLRAALGQYELAKPQQLVKLLVMMAHNKVIDSARKHAAERHEHQHVQFGAANENQVCDPASSPSQIAAYQELLQKFLEHLTPEERALAEQRSQGRAWADIAAERADSPEALRKQLARAVDRVAQLLHLEI